MTTKLQAINTMLSCIKHAPINSLTGTLNSFSVTAKNLLESETIRVQLEGYDFNSEDDYPLVPDIDNIIKLPENILKIEIPQIYRNQYVVRGKKLYDKYNHTYKIPSTLRASVVWGLDFEELPEVAQRYIMMSAAYKFVKRELGSQAVCVYTQQDVQEAKQDLISHELDIGNYSMIKEFYTDEIRSEL